MMAGAPGLEPGNGGIKIQVVRVIYQRAFRKTAEIPRQSAQEVSGHFGMPGCTSRSRDDARLCTPKAEARRSGTVADGAIGQASTQQVRSSQGRPCVRSSIVSDQRARLQIPTADRIGEPAHQLDA